MTPSGDQAKVLAIVGLSKEARLAAGRGVEAVGAGGSPHRLRDLLGARDATGLRAVVSFGIAGGLGPDLLPGDVVVASGILCDGERHATDAAVSAAITRRLGGLGKSPVMADLAGVDAAVLSVDAKHELRNRTGAAAVDMESHVAAAFARRHGLPFAAIRVVCDPAHRALPAFVATALKPNGDPDIRAVLAALARGQVGIGVLIRLARDSSAAFTSLNHCRALLGRGLGVPEASIGSG